jgi:hypothetical protein
MPKTIHISDTQAAMEKAVDDLINKFILEYPESDVGLSDRDILLAFINSAAMSLSEG